MTRILGKVALVALLLLSPLKFVAQTDTAKEKEKPYFVIVLTDEQASTLFENLRPLNPKNRDNVPVFTIKDRNDNFMMQFSGYISPIMGWDIGNVLDDEKFIPSSIPVPAAMGHKSDFFLNPLYSSLQIAITGKPGSANQVSGFIDIRYDGSGSSRLLKMHHLYLRYRGITMGRTTSLFSDGASIPFTIDPQGPNGAVSAGCYLLNYVFTIKDRWKMGIGLEMPSFAPYVGAYAGFDPQEGQGVTYYGEASQPVPDVPVFVQYKAKDDNRIRLSGILRNFYYLDTQADETKHSVGWGVQLSGNVQPMKPLVGYYQVTYGKGIGNYIQDTQGLSLSYVPENGSPGSMESTPMIGWLAGLRYTFADDVKIGAMYSEARVWDSGEYCPQYRHGQYVAANVTYPVKPYLTFGMEYLWGRHVEYGGETSHLNRIQGMVRLSF